MSLTTHLPSNGLPQLFRIGVKPLGDDQWIDVDDKLALYLDEKDRLAKERFDDIFVAEPGTEAAQAEVLARLVDNLEEKFPESYRRNGPVLDILSTKRRIALEDQTSPPLWIAASLVQEDLVLLRKGESGWRLAAAALCFPSSWRLAEKFGRTIHEIHAPVPGFGAQTRNATIIGRMFDNLRPETPMIRWNWSLYGDDELFHPNESDAYRFGKGARAENVFVRAERQVLTRLRTSGDILFTIRIYIDPLDALEKQPEAVQIAQDLIDQLHELDDAQLAYKGLTEEKAQLLVRLGELVS